MDKHRDYCLFIIIVTSRVLKIGLVGIKVGEMDNLGQKRGLNN